MWTLCLKLVDLDSPWVVHCCFPSKRELQRGGKSNFAAEKLDKYYLNQITNTSSDRLCWQHDL